MEKRLKNLLSFYSELCETEKINIFSKKDKKKINKELLIQINFMQHERLIHLIVTVTFAILTFIALAVALFLETFAGLLLCVLFFVLLIPYIRHYYILENGVQKLYEYYDILSK